MRPAVWLLPCAMFTIFSLPTSLAMAPTPLPKHLVMPPFPHTYNLSRSTMIQTCANSDTDPLDYLREWGIVSYDWSNLNGIWHNDHPMDSDVKLVDQATRAASFAPDTQALSQRIC